MREIRSGAGGQDAFDLTHTYDTLNRLTSTKDSLHNSTQTYQYDSLGNLTLEGKGYGNKKLEYWYNELNQQVKKVVDGSGNTYYTNEFDKRGNLVKSVYHRPGNPSEQIVEQYVYDATNRMVKGVNEKGEESHYIYNGLGDLVANEWVIAKNGYGYTGVVADPNERVGDVVVCDRHSHVTGNGHINPTGKGHTTGGTTGGVTPVISGQQAVIHKDYVLDYTDPLKRVMMETESGAGGLTYRYVYGLEKAQVVIYGIEGGAGSIMTFSADPDAGIVEYTIDDTTGEWVSTEVDTFPLSDIMQSFNYGSGPLVAMSTGTSIVKLYYHHDRLGTTDYLTDNVAGKVISYVTYDDWGALTAKAVLKCGVRELDLVQTYTVHPYDMVLGVYFAQARMYDAGDRRFVSVDVVDGNPQEPGLYNRYVYCADNPVRFTDPDGQLFRGEILKRRDGTRSLNTDKSQDILTLQLRLQILDYQSRVFTAYGYFDDETEKAVNAFKDKVIPGGNTGWNRGKVGATTWEKLGLEISISDNYYHLNSTPGEVKLLGQLYAKMLLCTLLIHPQENPLWIAVGVKVESWTIYQGTYTADYFYRLQCALKEQSLLGSVTQIISIGQNILNSFQDAAQVTGGEPLTTLGLASLNFLAETAKDLFYDPFDDDLGKIINDTLGAAISNDVEEKRDDLFKIMEIDLNYVLSPLVQMGGKYISSVGRGNIMSAYHRGIFDYIDDIRAIPVSTIKSALNLSTTDAEIFRKSAIDKMESIMRDNIDTESTKEWAKSILK